MKSYIAVAFPLLSVLFSSALAQNSTDQPVDIAVNNTNTLEKQTTVLANAIILSQYQSNPEGSPIGLFALNASNGTYDELPWQHSAIVWDTLIAYSNLTGDDRFGGIIAEGVKAQAGDDDMFMPANQTNTLSNTNQAQWALAAMSAAEYNHPQQLATDGLKLAQNVFDVQVERWDDKNCDGGLREHIYNFQNAYNFKSSFTASNNFLLAARLNKFTGNETFADWAEKQYTWSDKAKLFIGDWLKIEDDGSCTGPSEDGGNWATVSSLANFIYGAAVMRNTTGGDDSKWHERLNALMDKLESTFISNDNGTSPLYWVTCTYPEGTNQTITDCGSPQDEMAARAFALTAHLAPHTADTLIPLLKGTTTYYNIAKRDSLLESGVELELAQSLLQGKAVDGSNNNTTRPSSSATPTPTPTDPGLNNNPSGTTSAAPTSTTGAASRAQMSFVAAFAALVAAAVVV
ncbi:glycosyl hydrolase family 76-domain-containing protein [Lophiotrema nucula]|uniref:mannan endo-1,6-alpha-mannosidase n=1 Tax=Lophiotrema nucula TaxID=690887 RepID=A0A6A5ZT62_9PLEO|nr:glycosyl hydrolase family 76-domain-containing protein [Lophiotrema nucula]